MATTRTRFCCTECGADAPKWVGRCPHCEAWGTLVEEPVPAGGRHAPAATVAPTAPAVPIADVTGDDAHPRPTGVPEFDRVLGGGLVGGSVTLVGGEPGIGKSTLLLQVLAGVTGGGATALYVTAEESPAQVRARAERVGALRPRLWLADDLALPALVARLDEVAPDVVVVDSVQTVHDPELSSAPGSVGQVRQCTARLVAEAKDRNVAVVLVGHVTKDGGLAGPRVLEHLVDTVLAFDGDRHHDLRILRALKHRFGSTAELGVLRMTGDGLEGVADPSGLFLADRRPGVPGSVVVPTLDGRRPLLVEVQGLTAPTPLPSPRRSAQGLDAGRLAVALAVLEQRADVPVGATDVYAMAVGGVRVDEPGADLALALAVASSLVGRSLPEDLVVVGEVGLGGELRHVPHVDRRLAEASRHGFAHALVPPSVVDDRSLGERGVVVHPVATLAEALITAGVTA